MERFLLALVVAIASYATADLVRYDGYEVHRLTPTTTEQLQILRELEQKPGGFNFWTEPSTVGRAVDIMVPPNLKSSFENFVASHTLHSELWIENVQQRIEREKPQTRGATRAEFGWEDYHTLEEIYDWLDSLERNYPNNVTVVVGGESHEGRQIRGVKVSFGEGKKGAFIEGGTHAREWISTATVTYILNQLLTSTDPNVRAVAESRDWYVFPSANPDGYVYTHTTNRMWRKNRKPYGGVCVGADLNRNWDYHWMDGGASQDPCSETYAGPTAFSEIEAKSLSEYIDSVAESLDAYFAFHSYSQLIMIPFGHAGYEVPENNEELLAMGNAAAESLAERYGTDYIVGNIAEVVYVGSGCSADWALGQHRHIRLAYEYELRDQGQYGFLLPADQIVPTGEETLDSIVRIIQEADKDS